MINIQVVYILPENPTIIDCKCNETDTVLQAINQSGILSQFNLDLKKHKIGIYGKLVELDSKIKDNDRIEIYRDLINDPKEIRRKRAHAKAQS